MVSLDRAIDAIRAVTTDQRRTAPQHAAISFEKIASSIAELKSAAYWPKKVKKPAYNNKAVTIYLDIVPKKLTKTFRDSRTVVHLRHPLSLHRSVCYVTEGNEGADQQGEDLSELRKAGVTGDIQMVPQSALGSARASKQLFLRFDSLVLCPTAYRDGYLPARAALDNALAACGSFCVERRRDGLAKTLRASLLAPNRSKDGWMVAVGHVGSTNQQLHENVSAALKYVDERLKRMFPTERVTLRAVRLRVGTTQGVVLHRDNSGNKVAGGKDPMQAAASKIGEGVAKLVASSDWPKYGQSPALGDEAAVFLTLEPQRMAKSIPKETRLVRLVHPLCLRRSVCYVSLNNVRRESRAENARKLKAAGVQGELKMLSAGLLSEVFSARHRETLKELSSQFHAFLACPQSSGAVLQSGLAKLLANQSKACVKVEEAGFRDALAESLLSINQAKNGYVVAVGHTGLTECQLRENVAAAVGCLDLRGRVLFPDGLASLNSMLLTIGLPQGKKRTMGDGAAGTESGPRKKCKTRRRLGPGQASAEEHRADVNTTIKF